MCFGKVALLFFGLLFLGECRDRVSYRQKPTFPVLGIVGGNSIPITEAPYIASLRIGDNDHHCGSCIIDKLHLLTAAHCIQFGHKYTVVVGTAKLVTGGQTYDIEKIFVHRNYNKSTNEYDIALVKLRKPIKFGDTVGKIGLADKTTKIEPNMSALVTGWGSMKEEGPSSNELQQVAVSMVSREQCRSTYGTSEYEIDITPNMICAGNVGKDACQGDSGGPLTLDGKLIGVVSFGIGCGKVPGVYTDVVALAPWIRKRIGENKNSSFLRNLFKKCWFKSKILNI